jgi:4-oxalocrotonate tautomerase family enzyme
MPLMEIDLMAGSDTTSIAALADELGAAYAGFLEAPIERIRVKVTEVAPTHWRVGGTNEGDPSPLIKVIFMQGRKPEVVRQMIADLSALAATILDTPIGRVRVLVTEIPPEHWGIAGVPASQARADEIAARAAAT